MIKAVIFDFDNTLMDFMKMKKVSVEAAVDAMIDAGLKLTKAQMMEKVYSGYTKEGIEDQLIFDKVLKDELGTIDYKILASGIIGYRRAKEGSLSLYPHVKMTLRTLARQGIKTAVVSDAPRLPVWLRICSLGLQHDFDAVITSEDSGFKKPHPKGFQMALETLGTQPGETLMIGDWPERDVVGAKGVGMKVVFARYGDTTGTQQSGADYEVDDVADLLGIIREIDGI